MLHHIVLVKPKEGTTEAQLENLCQNASLLREIHGVISANVAKNEDPKSDHRYTLGIFVELEDPSALHDYLKHPKHREFASRYLHPIRGDTIVFDY